MISSLIYLCSAFLLVVAVDCLSSPSRVGTGYRLAFASMALALITCLAVNWGPFSIWVVLTILFGGCFGWVLALKIKLSSLPQMVALLNGVGGLASALIVLSEIHYTQNQTIMLFCFILGTITFSGSMVAYAKLDGVLKRNIPSLKWGTLILGLLLCMNLGMYIYDGSGFWGIAVLALLLGIAFTMPIGGADMPVIISLLNSFSGWAEVLVGLFLGDLLLIITGALVGASGTILSYVMSKSMNRSLLNILWSNSKNINQDVAVKGMIKRSSPEEAAFLMSNAHKVIIVPGFGMAAAQAQLALKNLTDILIDKYQVDVKFAIHPVAGRMPGHMNVLLAEARIPNEKVFSLEDINQQFASADVVYVIGANDVTNPLAKTDESSPLYGMPVLDVEKAKMVFFVKRSLAAGYSGVDNPLFYAPNTLMLFGDAKQITEEIVKNI